METENLIARAGFNLGELEITRYPGRGIIAGLDETGEYLVQGYWIMGRSENSRNRIFKTAPVGRLYTEIADPSKLLKKEERKLPPQAQEELIRKRQKLTIYNAMREVHGCYIVSNGDQTDTAADRIETSAMDALFLERMLAERIYEPDEPIFTQRITAVSWPRWEDGKPHIELSVLRKSDFGDGCDRMIYHYEMLKPGFGFCITTYDDDGDPPPPFRGEPLLVPLQGGVREVAETYFDVLDPDNRVSVAVKFIGIRDKMSKIHAINKYAKV